MVPLHERIRSDIETRILDGRLKPGDRLPIESELMQRYGCARMTVNKALSALVLTGFIDRRKRAGTFVAQPRLHAMVLDVPDLAQEVTRRGQSYAFTLLASSRRAPARSLPDEGALAAGGQLLQVDGLHFSNGAPLAFETRSISINAVPTIMDADFRSEAPGTWLLRHVPWTEAETRIAATNADPTTAHLLNVKVDTACLAIERKTWRGKEQITTVRQVFVGQSYDLFARFGSNRS